MRQLAIIIGAAGLAVSVGIRAQASQSPVIKSVREGVYSAGQATRGAALYEEKCSGCHAARMWGADWPEKTVADLFETISNYMPADNPGSLSSQQYRDVIAYILKTNKLPSGPTELPQDVDALRQIRVELP